MRELFGETYNKDPELERMKIEREKEEDESFQRMYYEKIEKDDLADCTVLEYLIGCNINSAGKYDCPKCEEKDIDGSKLFSLKCSHYCCFNCYSKYVREKIENGATYKTVLIIFYICIM